MVRIVVVDDQHLFRQGLVALLRDHPSIDVVAEASDGAQALAIYDAHTPDVVLMDMRMPGMDGPATIAALRKRAPQCRVIALTTFDDEPTVLAALRAGAVGYLLKDVAPERLVEAIEAAAAGRSIVDASVLPKVLNELQRVAHTPSVAPHGLSEREVQVLRALMQGKSNKEIGQHLHIAEGTVKNHVTSIFEKLNVTDRTSAALRGRDIL